MPDQVADLAEPLIRTNAHRLARDAQLLLENERYSSCAMLQFFALEEIGKIFLLRTSTRKSPHKFHLQKQLAAASLAYGGRAGRYLYKKLDELGVAAVNDTQKTDLADLEFLRTTHKGAIWHWLNTGGWEEFMEETKDRSIHLASARVGLFEYFRKCAIYLDSNGAKPDYLSDHITYGDFGSWWANEAGTIISDAFFALDDPPSFTIAAGVFEERIPTTRYC